MQIEDLLQFILFDELLSPRKYFETNDNHNARVFSFCFCFRRNQLF